MNHRDEPAADRQVARVIGDPSLADAILNRLVNNAYKLDLKGTSRRSDKPVNTN